MNKYIKKYIVKIKAVKNNKELENIIDKIYSEGFEDGTNEGNNK